MRTPPQTIVEQCECSLLRLDEEILLILADEGARNTRYIHHNVEKDVGKSWVCQRLSTLVEDGPVRRVDRGLYELEPIESEGTNL